MDHQNKECENSDLLLSHVSVIRGIQCQKYLYLNKFHPEYKKEYSQLRQLISRRNGTFKHEVKKLFGDGKSVFNEKLTIEELAEETKKLILSGEPLIFDAIFLFNNIYTKVDVTENLNGNLYFYTIVARNQINTSILNSIAVQHHVVRSLHENIGAFSAIYIDDSKEYKPDMNLHFYLKSETVDKFARQRKRYVISKIRKALDLIGGDKIPEKELDDHCLKPNICPYFNYCFPDVTENSVFSVGHMHLQKKLDLYRDGVTAIEDIPLEDEMTEFSRMQVIAEKTGEETFDKKGISEFLKQIKYPVSATDFESFQPIIPRFKKTKPLQHIPFQFVVATRENKNAEAKVTEYLGAVGKDPRKKFVERFLEETDHDGSILVYNKSSEIRTLNQLAAIFPKRRVEIEQRISRIVDLMEPFEKRMYYSPDMKGSITLKSIVAALIDGVSYDKLNIEEGGSAAFIYESLYYSRDDNEKERVLKDLSKYCNTDTIALLKILEKLSEKIK